MYILHIYLYIHTYMYISLSIYIYIPGPSARFARAEAHGIILWDHIMEMTF